MNNKNHSQLCLMLRRSTFTFVGLSRLVADTSDCLLFPHTAQPRASWQTTSSSIQRCCMKAEMYYVIQPNYQCFITGLLAPSDLSTFRHKITIVTYSSYVIRQKPTDSIADGTVASKQEGHCFDSCSHVGFACSL